MQWVFGIFLPLIALFSVANQILSKKFKEPHLLVNSLSQIIRLDYPPEWRTSVILIFHTTILLAAVYLGMLLAFDVSRAADLYIGSLYGLNICTSSPLLHSSLSTNLLISSVTLAPSLNSCIVQRDLVTVDYPFSVLFKEPSFDFADYSLKSINFAGNPNFEIVLSKAKF